MRNLKQTGSKKPETKWEMKNLKESEKPETKWETWNKVRGEKPELRYAVARNWEQIYGE